MHQNTFGGRAPPGFAEGAKPLPRPLAAMRGRLIRANGERKRKGMGERIGGEGRDGRKGKRKGKREGEGQKGA